MASRRWLLALIVGLTTASTAPAAAYEFEVMARTVGQGYQLRSFRLLGSDLILNRRRFTQTLSLRLWDLGRPRGPKKIWDSTLRRGPNIYLTTYMRIDHDFGGWTMGTMVSDNRVVDAIDLIPELESNALNLDLLYGYLAVEGLAGGSVDVFVGRQLDVDTLDWFSMDGVTVKVRTPWRFAVEGFGGLRVRDDTPLGSSVQEPDGTSGGQCAEYVEGATPGTGSWRPIDRDVTGQLNPFSNDFDFCPQREELMPTYGAAIETHQLPVWARLAYRRTQSKTVGLIGPADRFMYEDRGLYPDELGQAPKWGVNEERVAATVRATRRFDRGRGRVTPHAAVRYSLLHGLVDEWHAGVRLRYRSHGLEPEVFHSFPTFDGDSIFNVFSSEPYTDFRLTYDLAPAKKSWRGYARGWLRRYHTEDADQVDGVDANDIAAGGHVGARYMHHKTVLARLDLFHEDGYGGRRTGGYASSRWRVSDDLGLSSRLSLIDFDDALLSDFKGVSLGAQLGATYLINQGVAVHLLAEENHNRFNRSQFRLIGVIDLAFNPEL
jgi:hypothetical protein